jgi:hypothetical protein
MEGLVMGMRYNDQAVEGMNVQLQGTVDQMDYIIRYLDVAQLLPFEQHALRRTRVAEKEVEEQRSLLLEAERRYHRSLLPFSVFVVDFGTIPGDANKPKLVFG